ncbi:cytidine deaminase [Rickettsiella massiliensis]|uniref:cytidine deaminase n=1 Tax=Rickettsiella massiliensis TaxID=676517 RepID=UPI00029B2CAF|nr:cytidine deaminase [Rickettsiella massiliensis]
MKKYIHEMILLAKEAAVNAYVPLCKFNVGACIRTVEGKLFNCCNWENAATPLSQCAETSALSAMLTYQNISDIILVTPKLVCMPCGACRQRLIQFSNSETNFYSYNMDNEQLKAIKLDKLLPDKFTWKLS